MPVQRNMTAIRSRLHTRSAGEEPSECPRIRAHKRFKHVSPPETSQENRSESSSTGWHFAQQRCAPAYSGRNRPVENHILPAIIKGMGGWPLCRQCSHTRTFCPAPIRKSPSKKEMPPDKRSPGRCPLEALRRRRSDLRHASDPQNPTDNAERDLVLLPRQNHGRKDIFIGQP